MKRINILPVLMGVLSACSMQAHVQDRYDDAQAQCRVAAETGVGEMHNIATLSPEQQSAEIVSQFSICMNKSGWPVANPLKPKGGDIAKAGPLDLNNAAKTAPAPNTTAPTSPAPNAAQPAAPVPYQRTTDSPAATPVEAAAGRQF